MLDLANDRSDRVGFLSADYEEFQVYTYAGVRAKIFASGSKLVLEERLFSDSGFDADLQNAIIWAGMRADKVFELSSCDDFRADLRKYRSRQ